ncbi:MAG: substrate-binding domain-containing protein [Bacteroidaceae bacterium]|nr:substrate-binding domain-containing protein [Bacteroidaceae bacterium]
MKIAIKLIFLIVSIIGIACTYMSFDGSHKSRLVGVSQCAGGMWRQTMNGEIRREATLHDNVEVAVKVADDDPELQCRQIEELVDMGIDLLIVSPWSVDDISKTIDKVKARGIPVVLVDRKANTPRYDAFVAGDNLEVGRLAGEYVHNIYKGEKIVEMQGNITAAPVQDRHSGFVQELEKYGLSCQSFNCNWERETCRAMVETLLLNTTDKYIIFCHNDGMVFDAVLEARKHHAEDRITFIGVDGICGEGIDMIDRGEMTATVRYPTGGKMAMQAAIRIMEGDKLEWRDTLIRPIVVDKGNATAMRAQDETILSINADNERLGEKLSGVRHLLSITEMGLIACVLVVVFCVFLGVYMHRTNKKNKHLRLEAEKRLLQYLSERMDTAEGASPLPVQGEGNGSSEDGKKGNFVLRLQEVLSANLHNPDITADDLAVELAMGRSQFYHRVKEETGYGPKELLRIARLKQAALLLENGGHTIQEVCYLVGFSTPSYFAKCFKEYHGLSPSEFVKS